MQIFAITKQRFFNSFILEMRHAKINKETSRYTISLMKIISDVIYRVKR